MEHHIFQFFQHFISFPQVPIYLGYHQWWLDKRFPLFLHVNIAKITCGYGWNDRTTFPQPFILLLKLTTTACFLHLRDSLRLPETVILDHWFIFELILQYNTLCNGTGPGTSWAESALSPAIFSRNACRTMYNTTVPMYLLAQFNALWPTYMAGWSWQCQLPVSFPCHRVPKFCPIRYLKWL